MQRSGKTQNNLKDHTPSSALSIVPACASQQYRHYAVCGNRVTTPHTAQLVDPICAKPFQRQCSRGPATQRNGPLLNTWRFRAHFACSPNKGSMGTKTTDSAMVIARVTAKYSCGVPPPTPLAGVLCPSFKGDPPNAPVLLQVLSQYILYEYFFDLTAKTYSHVLFQRCSRAILTKTLHYYRTLFFVLFFSEKKLVTVCSTSRDNEGGCQGYSTEGFTGARGIEARKGGGASQRTPAWARLSKK